ncbi:unnamed protein product, partial [Rotaria sp. Silwood2]
MADEKVIKIMDQVHDIIFGSLQGDDDEEIDSVFEKLRTRLLDHIERDAANSSDYYYVPEPSDHHSWLLSICRIIQRLVKVKIPTEKILDHARSLTHEQIHHIQHH